MKRKLLSLTLAMVMVLSLLTSLPFTVEADGSDTIVFANLGLSNGTKYSDPFDGGTFTVTFAGGDNDGKYYTTGSGIRVYGKGTMTVASKSENNITSITVTYDGTNKPTTNNVVNVGTYDSSNGTWTGSSTSVIFTRPSGSGHWRIQSVAVTISDESSGGNEQENHDSTHEIGHSVKIEANCTEDGAKEYWYCTNENCKLYGNKYSIENFDNDTEPLNSIIIEHGHVWVSGDVVSPTCTQKGYTPYTCTRCQDTKKDDWVPATGHNWNDNHECSVCHTTDIFSIFTDDLVEGDYLIVYNRYAMKAAVSNNRFVNGSVTLDGEVIHSTDSALIWRIEKNGDYWTIYNEAENAYAASTNNKNQGQLLSSGSTDNAYWTIEKTADNTFEFINKARAAAASDSGNKYLRNNGSNGFACYSNQIGGSLSLYKHINHVHQWDNGVETKSATCLEEGETTYTCSICNETKVEPIPKTSHTEGSDGCCDVCGTLISLPYGDKYIIYWTNDTVSKELTGINVDASIGVATTYDVRPSGSYPLELIEGANVDGVKTYAFRIPNTQTYLSCPTDNNNYLTISSSLDEYSSFTITKDFNSSHNNQFIITNVGYTNRKLQFNNNSSSYRFSCYKGTQQNPLLVRYIDKGTSLTTTSDGDGAIVLNSYLQYADRVHSIELTSSFGEKVTYASGTNLVWTSTNDGLKVSYAVPMQNFKDEITIKLFDIHGNSIGWANGYTVCVQDYLDSPDISSLSNQVKAVVNAIEYIGRTAEAHFNSQNYDDAEYTSAIAEISTEFGTTSLNGSYNVTGTGFYGASLLLKDKVTLRFYFTVGDGYSVKIGNGEYNGSLTPAEGGYYYYDITGISAKDLNKAVDISIMQGSDTSTEVEVTGFSPFTYLAKVIAQYPEDNPLVYLCKALYLYQQSAAAYFGS